MNWHRIIHEVGGFLWPSRLGHEWGKLNYTVEQHELDTGLRYPEHQLQCPCGKKAYNEPINTIGRFGR